jgi:hypothetical protein
VYFLQVGNTPPASGLTKTNAQQYFFTYSGPNTAFAGFLSAITLVMNEPYLIGAFVAVALNLILPKEEEEEKVPPEPTSTELEKSKPTEEASLA